MVFPSKTEVLKDATSNGWIIVESRPFLSANSALTYFKELVTADL